MKYTFSFLLFALLVLPLGSLEAADYVPDADPLKRPAEDEEKPPQGWTLTAKAGAAFTFSHSKRMVGQSDGTTLQFTLLGETNADWRRDNHEWLNQLSVSYGTTKTPATDDYQKSADELAFKTIYFYAFESIDWLGVFSRVRATTSMFPGYHLQMDEIEILLIDRDGTVSSDGVLEAQKRYRLVDSFEPLILRESAGGFAKPFTGERLAMSIKLGGGVQQILVGDGYVVEDDGATPELELRQLESSNEAGAELELEANGSLNESAGWSLSANVFYPLVSSVDDDALDDDEKYNAELEAKVSIKLSDWANLEYQFTAKREPLVLNEWRIQNGLVLNLSVAGP